MRLMKPLLAGLAFTAGTVFAQPIQIDDTEPFHPEGRPLEGLVITLDPGHGGFSHQPGYTGSARGVNSRVVEGDINTKVAILLDHFLREAGAETHMTRRDDRKVSSDEGERAEELGARVRVADESASHLFLSIHHNAAARDTADGVVILIWPTDKAGNDQPLETDFANALEEEVKKEVHWKQDFNHYVFEHPLVMDSDIPSATVESGFLTNPEFDKWVNTPGSLEKEAVGLYNGVVRMWTEHRDDLEAKRHELFPDANSAVITPPEGGGNPGASLLKSIWPFDKPAESLDDTRFLIQQFRTRVITDFTIFWFDVDAEMTPGGVVINGGVNDPWVRDALKTLLDAAGKHYEKFDVQLLPSDRVAERPFGVTKMPMALTWSAPKEGVGVESQLLLGDEVWLLDETADGTYLLVMGPEGYGGWVTSNSIRRMTAEEFDQWRNTPKAFLKKEVMVDDFILPMGAGLPVITVDDATTVTVSIPKGVRATSDKTAVDLAPDEVTLSDSLQKGREAALSAATYLNVPYLFGGRSPLGLDCSGLTGTAYGSVGLALPRDARQQVLVGRLVATSWHKDGLQPGDLLFFIGANGRVIHTGVSLGGSRFIHASPPRVQVNSLDEADPLYSDLWTKHFSFAKRPSP